MRQTRKRITKEVKEEVLRKCGYRCINCGSTEELELHHVMPLEIGGNDIPSNMVVLCYDCHKAVTHFQLLLMTAGRKHTAGGRPRKIPDNYEEILDRYVRCEFGTKECVKQLRLSGGSHISDNPWYREYTQKRGIKSFRSRVDLRLSKGMITKGDPVGKIVYLDGTEETVYAPHDIMPDKAPQMEFDFNSGSQPKKAHEYRGSKKPKPEPKIKNIYDIDSEWWRDCVSEEFIDAMVNGK